MPEDCIDWSFPHFTFSFPWDCLLQPLVTEWYRVKSLSRRKVVTGTYILYFACFVILWVLVSKFILWLFDASQFGIKGYFCRIVKGYSYSCRQEELQDPWASCKRSAPNDPWNDLEHHVCSQRYIICVTRVPQFDSVSRYSKPCWVASHFKVTCSQVTRKWHWSIKGEISYILQTPTNQSITFV